jgi:hypothetical protein
VHCESKVAAAVAQGQFGNPGRGIAVVSQYKRTGVGQQTERTRCVRSELQTDRVKMAIAL